MNEPTTSIESTVQLVERDIYGDNKKELDWPSMERGNMRLTFSLMISRDRIVFVVRDDHAQLFQEEEIYGFLSLLFSCFYLADAVPRNAE